MSKAHKCEVCESLYEGRSHKKRNFIINISQFDRRSADISLLNFDIIWNYTETPQFAGKSAHSVDLCDECFDQVILRIAKAILHPLCPEALTNEELSRRIRVDENGNGS